MKISAISNNENAAVKGTEANPAIIATITPTTQFNLHAHRHLRKSTA
jgi:hypothetical protein